MSILAVNEAVKARLEAMQKLTGSPLQGFGVVWQNDASVVALPRLEVNRGPTSNRTITLDGATDSKGLIQITVVVAVGTFDTEAGRLVQDVIDWFPIGQTLGAAEVYEMPSPSSPIQDGTEYRIPITIKHRSFL